MCREIMGDGMAEWVVVCVNELGEWMDVLKAWVNYMEQDMYGMNDWVSDSSQRE